MHAAREGSRKRARGKDTQQHVDIYRSASLPVPMGLRANVPIHAQNICIFSYWEPNRQVTIRHIYLRCFYWSAWLRRDTVVLLMFKSTFEVSVHPWEICFQIYKRRTEKLGTCGKFFKTTREEIVLKNVSIGQSSSVLRSDTGSLSPWYHKITEPITECGTLLCGTRAQLARSSTHAGLTATICTRLAKRVSAKT